MTDTPQPTSGSLSAKIIRACKHHADSACSLNCRYRQVEDLGQIASFDSSDMSHDPSFLARLKEAYRQWNAGR